ncbi:MAG: AAA family ATPase [bacterium]|nr:AAA family ATPase [bacterium]
MKTSSFFLFGARGTGKSTLLESVLERSLANNRCIWINLLSAKEEARYLEDPDLLSRQIELAKGNLDWVIIDEVQKAPKLLDVVHNEIELASKEKRELHFALSGSSARKLKRGGANLLAGRAFVYHLFPFTHIELAENFNLDQALQFGTIPAIIKYPDVQSKQAALEAYVETYLKEEIVAEQIIRNVQPFRKFLNIAAQSNGTIINFNKISGDIKVDDKTVKTYFDILEETLLGFSIPAYDKSLRKQQGKSPKFYLFDPGVKRVLDPDLPAATQLSSQEYGLAFEHFVICEIFRIKSYQRQKMSFSHFNTGNSEIDLVIEVPGGPDIFIEIKATEQVRESHIATLSRLQSDYPEFKYLCLSRDPIARIDHGINILPWQMGIKKIFEGGV